MPVKPGSFRPARKGKVHGQNRQRGRQYNTGSKAWRAIREQVLLRDDYTCRHCGRYGNHVDHIDGDSQNNPPDGSNWQTLCLPCHTAKTSLEIRGQA